MLFFLVLSVFFIQAPEENVSPASSASLSFFAQHVQTSPGWWRHQSPETSWWVSSLLHYSEEGTHLH